MLLLRTLRRRHEVLSPVLSSSGKSGRSRGVQDGYDCSEGPPDPAPVIAVRLDLSPRVVSTSPSVRLHGPRRRQRSTRRDIRHCCPNSTPSGPTPRRPGRLTIHPRTPTVVEDLPRTLPTKLPECPVDHLSSGGVGRRRRHVWGLHVSSSRPPSLSPCPGRRLEL